MPIWVGIAKTLIRLGIAQRLPPVRRLMEEGLPYLRYYNGRILASPNVELKAAAALLDQVPGEKIDLSLGAPPIDPDLASLEYLDQQAEDGYPPVAGLWDLRVAVAEKLKAENGLAVDPKFEVLISNGVSQGIGLMLDTFVDPGDRVTLFDPSFFLYRLAAQNRRARIGQVPTWLENGYTKFSERDLRKSLRRSKVLFLNSPANPTGGVLCPEDLERIAFRCSKEDVLIFSDEVYERFLYQGEHLSIGSLPAAKNRTITANGFSKSHGMAAMRVGYLAGQRYLIQPMIVSCLATTPFVSISSQRAALLALQRPADRFEKLRKRYSQRRSFVSGRLNQIGFDHELPGGAFYFWIPVGSLGLTGEEFARRLLAEKKVLVLAGKTCGSSGRDHIRISYSGPEPELREGLDRIEKFVTRHWPRVIPFPDRGSCDESPENRTSFHRSA